MDERITIITGNAGSGKTEFAIQYALWQRNFYKKLNLVDLDVINVYYRSRENIDFLEKNNIKMWGSGNFSFDNSDLPNVSYGFESLLGKNITDKVIIDLAGTENGLKLLMALNNKNFIHDLWFVCNIYREETDALEKIINLLDKYENFSGFKITGLINNSNLLEETKEEDVIYGDKILEKVSKMRNIPITYTMTTIMNLRNKLINKNILYIEKLHNSQNWLRSVKYGKR